MCRNEKIGTKGFEPLISRLSAECFCRLSYVPSGKSRVPCPKSKVCFAVLDFGLWTKIMNPTSRNFAPFPLKENFWRRRRDLNPHLTVYKTDAFYFRLSYSAIRLRIWDCGMRIYSNPKSDIPNPKSSWLRRVDSNHYSQAYETCALPFKLHRIAIWDVGFGIWDLGFARSYPINSA